MVIKVVEVKTLKVGKFVMIDGEPCKVVGIQKAKTGKHGSAKARVEAIGILDNQKHSLVKPVDQKIDIPIIERKTAQVLAFIGKNVQLMDLENYTTFELPKPKSGEIKGTLVEGGEVDYIKALNKCKILRAR
tara:strand:- start:2569 stop:2964 length:396 start_codon:yes stop_codon:yes gene_type:complete